MNDETPSEPGIFTIDELIDTCLNPYHINFNILNVILKIIASKLNLQTIRVSLVSPNLMTEIQNIIAESKKTIEGFKILEGGKQRPFKVSACKLERMYVESDPPAEQLYRVSKKSSTRDDQFAAEEIPSGTRISNLECSDLSNRLEACENEIKKLSTICGAMSCDELEAKVVEGRQIRTDINLLNEKTQDMEKQLCQLINTIKAISRELQQFKEEQSSFSKALEEMPSGQKLNLCFEEICKLQKKVAQNTDKIADLNTCLNKLHANNKALDNRLSEVEKLKALAEKVRNLDEVSKKTIAEFDVFTERLDHLKMIKADHEEVEYLLQFKADKVDLQDLITLDVFNKTTFDLSSNIDQTFENLAATEIKWRKFWYEMQSQIDEKMERSEKAVLVKFINQKIKQAFQGCKNETRSADVSSQIQRNIQRISSIDPGNVQTRGGGACPCDDCNAEGPYRQRRFCGGSHTIISPRKRLEQRRSVPLYYTDEEIEVCCENGKIRRIPLSDGGCKKQIYPKVMYPSRKANTKKDSSISDEEKKIHDGDKKVKEI